MRLEIYDLECLSNLFTYTGYDGHKKQWFQYVIHDSRNEIHELYKHLTSEKLLQVGYNNENYDYPLEHFLIAHYKGELEYQSGLDIAQKLYNKSQEIIETEFSAIADKHKFIQQIDLFKIFHYDNKARKTSLKDLEIQMRMENIEEMPLHHTHWCQASDIDMILSYNKNDVDATYKFLLTALGKTDYSVYKGKDKIKLRMDIMNMFKIPCLNYPDVKIGEQLILKLYAQKTNQSPYDLKKAGGTIRDQIELKQCIPHWANFKTPEFNKLKQKFESTIITNIKGEFSESVIFHGTKIDYGTGGAHSSIKPGVYRSDDYWMILDEDIGSLYPSLAIQLGLYPQHLGPKFLEIYDGDIVSVRLAEKRKPKNERNNVIMEGYKLAANGIYGKSGEESSFLYDPLYTMKTTIGGQMFLSLWTEKLVLAIPEIKFLQHNTDGITYLLPRRDLQKAKDVAEEMTKLTGLYIEDNVYSMMAIRDVNNYLAVYEDHTPEHEHYKCKGCFEIDKEYHKDPSMRIVPIALKEYFIYNKPIEETIRNHNDVFDFCMRLKTNSKTDAIYRYVDLNTSEVYDKKLDRTTRYYVSTGGGVLLKDFGDNRVSGVNVGYSVTLFNKYQNKPMKDYKINYNFYIGEANKIVYVVDDKQLTLF